MFVGGEGEGGRGRERDSPSLSFLSRMRFTIDQSVFVGGQCSCFSFVSFLEG